MNTPATFFIRMKGHVYQGIILLEIVVKKIISTKVVYFCNEFVSEM